MLRTGGSIHERGILRLLQGSETSTHSRCIVITTLPQLQPTPSLNSPKMTLVKWSLSKGKLQEMPLMATVALNTPTSKEPSSNLLSAFVSNEVLGKPNVCVASTTPLWEEFRRYRLLALKTQTKKAIMMTTSSTRTASRASTRSGTHKTKHSTLFIHSQTTVFQLAITMA